MAISQALRARLRSHRTLWDESQKPWAEGYSPFVGAQTRLFPRVSACVQITAVDWMFESRFHQHGEELSDTAGYAGQPRLLSSMLSVPVRARTFLGSEAEIRTSENSYGAPLPPISSLNT